MGEIIVLAELFQCLRSAGNDTTSNTLFHIGEAIKAFAAQHRVGDNPLFAHPLQGAGAYFQQVGQLLACEPDFRCLLR